jgi:hypothetical protein
LHGRFEPGSLLGSRYRIVALLAMYAFLTAMRGQSILKDPLAEAERAPVARGA